MRSQAFAPRPFPERFPAQCADPEGGSKADGKVDGKADG
jgi:hypothetical protein